MGQYGDYGNLFQIRTLAAAIDAGNNGEKVGFSRVGVVWDQVCWTTTVRQISTFRYVNGVSPILYDQLYIVFAVLGRNQRTAPF